MSPWSGLTHRPSWWPSLSRSSIVILVGRAGACLPWGHVGATSGPRTTGAQRTRTVTVGLSSAQLTDQAEADVAGRRDAPRLPDTEEVLR